MIDEIRKIEDSTELKALLRTLAPKEVDDWRGKKVLSDTGMYAFRGVPIWVAFVEGQPVSINVSYFGKRKKNVWMPYMNFYIAFTRLDVRRRGYAWNLAMHVRQLAENAGCIRLKSMACTELGVRFHQKTNDDIWAFNPEQNVLLIDTPLVPRDRFPSDSTPIEVRPWTDNITPMTNEEVEFYIKKGLKYDCQTVRPV